MTDGKMQPFPLLITMVWELKSIFFYYEEILPTLSGMKVQCTGDILTYFFLLHYTQKQPI